MLDHRGKDASNFWISDGQGGEWRGHHQRGALL